MLDMQIFTAGQQCHKNVRLDIPDHHRFRNF